jgi:hypothetical protein
VIDIRLFGDARPGMSHSEANSVIGPPNSLQEENGSKRQEYLGRRSRVEVVRETSSSGGPDAEIFWLLYAYPKEDHVTAVIRPAALRQLNLNSPETTLLVRNDRDQIVILVKIVGRRVNHLIWYDR